MEQEKKNIRQRFNIIDALLIIVLIVLLVLIFFKIRDNRIVGRTSADAEVLIKIEFSPVYDELKSLAEVGSEAYDLKTGDPLGEITDVSYTDYYLEGISQSGEKATTRIPGMSAVTVTVRSSVSKSELGSKLNGKLLTLGNEIALRTSFFSGTGKIISIVQSDTEVA